MTLKEQTDKELADAGRMLARELSTIADELADRGVEVELKAYYITPLGKSTRLRYEFEAKRVTEVKL